MARHVPAHRAQVAGKLTQILMPILKGSNIIVTGASRGLGLAIALELARNGAGLFLVADGTLDSLQRAAGECKQAGAAGEVRIMQADLGQRNAADDMVRQAVDAMGSVYALVNNAGIRMRKLLGEYSGEDFDRLIAVNLRAPFFASQAVLPHMRAAGGGRIVNIASQMGLVAQEGIALYSLAKAALIQFTRSTAFEAGRHNIQVNSVSPGPAATEDNVRRMTATPELHAERMRYMVTGRLVECDEVAKAVLFLLSTDATSIQGHNLLVDGGYTIH